MECGVYKLTVPSGEFYIGSTVNLRLRSNHHRWASKHKKSRNLKLYQAISEQGSFVSEIIVACRPDDLMIYEQICIDTLKPSLNVSQRADKIEMTDEIRSKIGAANTRRVPFTCPQCSETKMVKPNVARDRKTCSMKCAGASRRGRKFTDERRANISAAMVGKATRGSGWTHSEETKARLREASTGRKHSPEAIEKMRMERWGK